MHNCECEDRFSKEELLEEIMAYKFSIVDLSLYLDTHPKDARAMACLKERSIKHSELFDKYQRKYGPLEIDYPCDKCKWVGLPWPWQKGGI